MKRRIVSESGKRLKAFRKKKGWSHADTARELSVGRTAIPNWEKGWSQPPAEVLVKLGNVAEYPECLWFWRAAGLEEKKLSVVAEKLVLEGRAAPLAEGEQTGGQTWVRLYQETEGAVEGPKLQLPLISRPLTTRYLWLGPDSVIPDEPRGLSNHGLRVGDAIVFEIGQYDQMLPWGEIVLTCFRHSEHGSELFVGQLGFREDPLRSRSWRAMLLVPGLTTDIRIGGYVAGPGESLKEYEEVRKKIRLDEGWTILGRVVAWWPKRIRE